jgi:hypothetical protein
MSEDAGLTTRLGHFTLSTLRLIAPTALAVGVTLGMVQTLASMVGATAPDLGYFRFVDTDALSLFYGHSLYHDPESASYVASVYPPVAPVTIMLLDHLVLWEGWGVTVNVVATAALATVAAIVAHRQAAKRGVPAAVRAAGLGALGVWVATIAARVLYVPWVDPLAWALALGGLVLVLRADRSRWAGAGAIALMTAGVWTKQTTVVVPLAATIWLVLAAWRGRRSVRTSAAFLLALIATNLLVLGAGQLASHGWETFYVFTLPREQVRIHGLDTVTRDVVESCGVPLLIAGAALLTLAARRPRELRGWLRSQELEPAALLGIFVVVALAGAMYFRQKAGAEQNHYIGVDWGLALVTAFALGRSQRSPVRGAVADAVIAGAALLAVIGTVDRNSRYDLHLQHATFDSVPADLRALGARMTVYDPNFGDLDSRRTHHVYPPGPSVADLLAGGHQPRGLVRQLLARRFDAVVPFRTALAPIVDYYDAYASGFGRYEEHYLWKVDRVIEAGYAPKAGYPAGVLVRRAGPNRALALAGCFGPFSVGSERFDSRQGGGLWCESAPALHRISMRGSPAPISHLVSARAVAPAGAMTIAATSPRSGITLALTGSAADWEIDANPVPGGWALGLVRPGQSTATLRVRSGPALRLRLIPPGSLGLTAGADGSVDAAVASPTARGRFTIAATTKGDVSLDLRDVTMRGAT